MPSFNSDDVIQIQTISQDARTFLAQGRWGYFLVFEWLQDNNPGGLFYSAIGCGLLLISSWFGAQVIGLKHAAAVYSFMLISCVSIYYGMLFDFSSTWIAYPLGNFFSLGGIYSVLKRQYLTGLVALTLSPSFYPASAQVAGLILLCLVFSGVMTQQARPATKRFLIAATALIFGLILYYFMTRMLFYVTGLEASTRMSISPLAFISNAETIKSLFFDHSIAFISFAKPSSYVSLRWTLPLLGIFSLFVIVCILVYSAQLNSLEKWIAVLIATLLLFAPFALAFAASNTPFPPRSLIALASLHAFWVAFVIDSACRQAAHWRYYGAALVGVLSLALLFVFDSASQINKFAYDKYLATQSDLFATNRIISRIENVAATIRKPLATSQPLVVIYEVPLPAGPRGDAGTSRFAPWSREWIFRLVDTRFIPAPEKYRKAAVEAAKTRSDWPAEDSVFFIDDVVVVIVNQVRKPT